MPQVFDPDCVASKPYKTGSYSMLGPLQDRELTDLGTEPYQEFLTLILNPRIAFLYGYF